MGRGRLGHWMATTSALALAVGMADQARAGCTTNLGSSCTNSGTVTYLYVSGAANPAVTNSGTISPGGGFGIGIYVQKGSTLGSITNSAGGYIKGGGQSGIQVYGILGLGATLGSITNGGRIVASGGTGQGIYIIGNVSVTGGITNTGTISAPNGPGIWVTDGSRGTSSFSNGITNGGVIQASIGIQVSGSVTTFGGGITNSGTIAASGNNAVYVGNAASFSGGITNSGSISSANRGIFISSPASFGGGITNTSRGSISGVYAISITGVAGTVTNAGTLTGSTTGASYGAVTFAAAGSTLTNSGVIQNTGGGNAVRFRGGNDALILGSGAQFTGNVVGTGSANTLILSGVTFTNALASQLSGFNYNNSPIVQGTGTNIAGSFAFTALTVQGGLTIDGSVTTGSLALGSGAAVQVGDSATPSGALISNVSLNGGVLSGFGKLTGNVTNTSGTLTPGSATTPGSLTITGNYTQGANGTLAILATPSASAKLAVSGTASLAGALALTVSGTGFTTGQKIPILTAGSITGTFATTSGLTVSPRLSFALSYSGSEVDLTAIVTTSLQSSAVTGNQAAVGALLDRLSAAPPAGLVPLFGALNNLAPAQVPQALDAVGGAAQHYSGFASAGIIGAQVTTNTIGQQLFQGHGAAAGGGALAEGSGRRVQLASLDPVALLAQGPAPTPHAASSPWSAWLDGYGIFGDIGATSAGHGLSYSTGGTAFGADYRLDPALLVGAFAGYAGTGTSAPGLAGSGSIDAYAFGVYASWTRERLYVDGMLGYAYDDDRLTRAIAFPGFNGGTARGNTHANQFLSSIETGRSYDLPESFVATPFVGLQATTLDQASFTESGAGALNLAVGGQSTSSVRTQLGSRVSRDVRIDGAHVVNIGLKLGWAHELSDTGTGTTASFAGAPGAAFAVRGVQRGRDSALLGVGAAARLDAMSSVYLRYDGDINGGDNAHAVIGGLRLTW